jgi:glycyl-tRNA synthetase beta subunit
MRVLTARFSDAAYFHKLDKENSLDEMAAQLGRLIFQEQLGTISDKRGRLIELSQKMIRCSPCQRRMELISCGPLRFAKADLVSRMVVELSPLFRES